MGMSISAHCILWVGVVHVLGVICITERDACVFSSLESDASFDTLNYLKDYVYF
jgi:hypothetical protein